MGNETKLFFMYLKHLAGQFKWWFFPHLQCNNVQLY